ncbi:MAG: 2OG-Fe(II) oxygenase [Dermatophilaceae bacterium]
MARSARERLARLLDDTGSSGSFSAQVQLPARSLQLEVRGVGPVRLPLRAPQTKKLIAAARPARFGRGEQTLTDATVRDTWELSPDQLTLGGSDWTAQLDSALEHFRDELGLPPTARLRAEPHSMLVYGKGQFFLPHQDSEKDDAMVGTLVVSLPSVHTGGELVVDHGGTSATYHASRDELTFVAFYADCRHQVTPVRSGYRVTVTYNLLTDTDTDTAAAEPDPADELARCLTEHFTTSATQRYSRRELDPPNRLVVLLDHEYTQRGLSWRRLKGVDAERAARVRAAAVQAGCETVLALAEVKETWGAEPAGDHGRGYYGYDQDDPDPDTGDLQLTELIDDEITLGWWTGPDRAGGERISLDVRDHEMCAVTPSAGLAPYESEYTGYMGNYGNTLDRWYRRAAIVVWPQDRAFAARAEAGSQWAIGELRARIDNGDLQGARSAAGSLAPFWRGVGAQPGLLGAVLDVAAGLGVATTARMLLEPFRVGSLTLEHASGVAAAAGRYGDDWTRTVIDGWFVSQGHDWADLADWVDTQLPGLCEALRDAAGSEPARLLAAGAWHWMSEQLRHWTTTARVEIRRPQLEQLSLPLTRLLDAADATLHTTITHALREHDDTVLECLIPALRLADARGTEGLDTIARDCADRLGVILARPPRDADDWSIAWTGCRCDLCDHLRAFLASTTERNLAWPLAKDGRGHIHTQIDAAALPVRHQTRRQGRPYTLELTKTDALFTRDQDERRQAATDLAWLTSTSGRPATRSVNSPSPRHDRVQRSDGDG